jgi:caa(3)-type oxidase subunit IV
MSSEAHIHHPNYIRIWAVLLVLLVVSVLGPLTGIRPLILITAFGVAVVKAYLVARNFMHVNIERRWIPYLLLVCLILVAVLFVGVAPDVMKHRGLNWENYSAQQAVSAGMHPAASKHE